MTITRRGLVAASALGMSGPQLMRVSDALAQGIQPRRGGTLTS